jgi:hypothetical protein
MTQSTADRYECRRLRQGWRRMGCRYQHMLGEKDVTIVHGGVDFGRRPFR